MISYTKLMSLGNIEVCRYVLLVLLFFTFHDDAPYGNTLTCIGIKEDMSLPHQLTRCSVHVCQCWRGILRIIRWLAAYAGNPIRKTESTRKSVP